MPTRLYEGDTVLVNLDDQVDTSDAPIIRETNTANDVDREYRHIHIGVVKYIGFIHGFDMTQFIGVELIESVPFGHSGIINDYQYFTCTDGHGIHTRVHKVLRKLEASEVAHKMKEIIILCKQQINNYVQALVERDAYVEDLLTMQRDLHARLKEAKHGIGDGLSLSPPQAAVVAPRLTSMESVGSFGSAQTDLSHLTLQNRTSIRTMTRLNTIDEFEASLLLLRARDSMKQASPAALKQRESFVGDLLRGMNVRRQSIEVDVDVQYSQQQHSQYNPKFAARRRHRRSVSSNATVIRHSQHDDEEEEEEDSGGGGAGDEEEEMRGSRHDQHRRRNRNRDGGDDGGGGRRREKKTKTKKMQSRGRPRRHSSMSDITELTSQNGHMAPMLKTRYISPAQMMVARDDEDDRSRVSKTKKKSKKPIKRRKHNERRSRRQRTLDEATEEEEEDDDEEEEEEHPSDDEVVVVVERVTRRDHDHDGDQQNPLSSNRSRSVAAVKRKKIKSRSTAAGAAQHPVSKRGQSNKTTAVTVSSSSSSSSSNHHHGNGGAVARSASSSSNRRGHSNQSTKSEKIYLRQHQHQQQQHQQHQQHQHQHQHVDAVMIHAQSQSRSAHTSPYHGPMVSPSSSALFSPPISPRVYGMNLASPTSPNGAGMPSLSQSYSNPPQLAMAAPLEQSFVAVARRNGAPNSPSQPKQVHFQFQQQQQAQAQAQAVQIMQRGIPVRKDSHGRSLSWNPLPNGHGGGHGGHGGGGGASQRGHSNHSASNANSLHHQQQLQHQHQQHHQQQQHMMPLHQQSASYAPHQTNVNGGHSYYNRQPQVDAWVNGQHK